MANKLLTNATQLKELLGKVMDVSIDSKGILPFVEIAYTKYLVKAFGDSFLQWISIDSNINGLTPQGYIDSHNALREKLRSCLAFYSYYEYSSFGLGSSTANGLVEQKTETATAARKWVFDERKAKSIELASEMLEQAIGEVLTYRTLYIQFYSLGTPNSYLKFFNQNGAALGESVPSTSGSNRLWLILRPFMKKVQRDILANNIGSAFMNEIIDRQIAGTLTVPDLALLPYLQEAEGYNAYAMAFDSLIFRSTSSGGIRIYSEFDGTIHADSPSEIQINSLKNSINSQAEASISKLNSFLAKNITDYPVYSTSNYYVPSTGIGGPMDADKYNTIFPIS